jgi:cytochrome c-type biogenesis protein CcsB
MTIINDYQLPIIACFCLFFAMIAYWISLSFTKNNLIFQFSKVLVGISNLLFMATLSIRWISQGYFPLSNLYESLIFLSWGISFIHLIVEYKTQSRLIGAISTPLLFFLSGFSSLTLPTEMQKALPLVPSLQSNWLMMHVSMMMVSYATLILGSLLSILYLAFVFFSGQTNDVKLEVPVGESATAIASPVSSSKLSLLQTVDIWSYRIIGLGFHF